MGQNGQQKNTVECRQQGLQPSVCACMYICGPTTHLFTLSYREAQLGGVLPQHSGLREVTIAEKWVKLSLKCFDVTGWILQTRAAFKTKTKVWIHQKSSSEREALLQSTSKTLTF